MSNRYQHKPLDPDHIRLLHILPESTANDIRCHLVDYSPDLSKRNRFAALSYCWGDPTPVATITIDGKHFDVAQNLYDFLQNRFLHGSHQLSHDHESSRLSGRGLWVDAICINQVDNEEKSSQVQGMWRVYSCADLIIAWLGKEKAFTAQAFRTLRSLDDGPAVTSGYTAVELLRKDFANVWLLCQEPYFSRMWVVQEVVCAHTHLMLHSGPHVVPFESLLDHRMELDLVAQTEGREGLSSDGEFLLITNLRLLLRTVRASRDAQAADLNTENGRVQVILACLAALNMQSGKQCSDIRDKIFALRSLPEARMMESELSIPPIVADYTMSVDETAVATLMYFSRLELQVQLYGGAMFRRRWLRDAIYSSLGVDILSEGFRTWLLQKINRDDEQGILEMITDSGRRIDCLCPAVRYILKERASEDDASDVSDSADTFLSDNSSQ